MTVPYRKKRGCPFRGSLFLWLALFRWGSMTLEVSAYYFPLGDVIKRLGIHIPFD